MSKQEYKIGEVKLSLLNRFTESMNKQLTGSPETDPTLTFELVIGSLFPVCYKNVKQEMLRQHGLGYKAGYEDAINESKRNN